MASIKLRSILSHSKMAERFILVVANVKTLPQTRILKEDTFMEREERVSNTDIESLQIKELTKFFKMLFILECKEMPFLSKKRK